MATQPRVFYMPPSDEAAGFLPASISMPAPAVLRALSETPAPPTAVMAEPARTETILPGPQIAMEDWSLPTPPAASSQEEDTVRAVAMMAAQRKEQSSRRFSLFR
jgi:hypothetical protein